MSHSYGHVADDLVRLAIVAVIETTMVDGIFHGDLHPGNVFVTERGLALLDFGIVGRLDPGQRRALVRLMMAGMADDQHRRPRRRSTTSVPCRRDADVTALVELLPDPPTMDERRAFSRPVADGGPAGRIIGALARQRLPGAARVDACS